MKSGKKNKKKRKVGPPDRDAQILGVAYWAFLKACNAIFSGTSEDDKKPDEQKTEDAEFTVIDPKQIEDKK
jgi:hypothetical protein